MKHKNLIHHNDNHLKLHLLEMYLIQKLNKAKEMTLKHVSCQTKT